MISEIPGLAEYLPAKPSERQPGYCDHCGKKMSPDEYDPELVKQGYWQPSTCQLCLDKLDD